MRLATRIRAADPLRGELPEALRAPAPPPGGEPAPRRRVPRRYEVAAVAAICTLAIVLVAVLRSGGSETVRTYQVSSAAGGAAPSRVVARSVGIVQARLAALGVRGVRVEAGDGGTIRLSCDGCSAATLTAAERATAPAQLLFYDWEPNLLDARCRPAPAAGAGATSRYRAVLRAARCPARRYRLMSHTAPVYYAVDDARGRVLAGPGPSPSAVLAGGGRAVRVLPGTTVVADPENGQWYVLRDDAAVTGAETTDPRAETDGATGAPIVTLRFTPPGQSEMRTLTRRVARRGQARQLPGLAPQTAAQHFAVALDDRLLALPFVDFRANPDGIDSHEGLQIQGGFTKQRAQALAALLQSGSLPARLIPRPGP